MAAVPKGAASAAQEGLDELDKMVAVVREILELYTDAACTPEKLQQLATKYKEHSAALRSKIRNIDALRSTSQSDAAAVDGEAAAEVAKELERLKDLAGQKNEVVYGLITSLRNMLDNVVMWESYSKHLSQDMQRKQDVLQKR